MTVDEASAVLENFFMVYWTATPIAFENVELRNWQEPGQPLLPEGDEDYIFLRSSINTSTVITVPGRCRRYQGTIRVGVAVRDGTGTRIGDGYAADLINLLEGRELSEATGMLRIWTLVGSVKYRPTSGWYVNELAFNFSFERYVS